MSLRSAAIAIWLVVGAVGTAPALAFQQTAPPTPQSEPGTSVPNGELRLDQGTPGPGTTGPRPEAEKKRFRAFDFLPGKILPEKLDFGLELLYGAPENEAGSGSGVDDLTGDDMTILGRFKRRF